MFKSDLNICLQDVHLFVPSPEPFMLSGSLSKGKFQYLPIFTNIYDIDLLTLSKTRYASTNQTPKNRTPKNRIYHTYECIRGSKYSYVPREDDKLLQT